MSDADLLDQARDLAAQITALPLDARVTALNVVRTVLASASPFAAEPVDQVIWLPATQVQANDYNPNHVAPPALRWLERSLTAYGFAMPIVATRDDAAETVTIVDGAHRALVGRERPSLRERLHGYLPVALLRTAPDLLVRYGATQAFNQARGEHATPDERAMVIALVQAGFAGEAIGRALGKTPDEILRYMQTSGLADLFRDRPFSRARE